MNWLIINIILFQFLGQALSHLPCLKSQKCSCQKHVNEEEIQVTCNSSTVTANLIESLVQIHCKSDNIHWEQSFEEISFMKLEYTYCLLNTGIHQIMSMLGINEVQSIKLISMKLNSSLEGFYLSNLESVRQLDISNTQLMSTNERLEVVISKKLILTNESFRGTPNLTRLFLRQNNIEELPNGIFKDLLYLEVLDLGGNKISIIESNLFGFIPLKGLILDSNNLTTLNLKVQSLKHLDVSNNRLMSITVEHLNKLVDLSLNKNILIKLPDEPFQNTSLQIIKLNYCNFNIPHKFLTHLDQLLKVHIKSSNLEKVPENMIWNSSNITELSLASNHLKEIPLMFFRDSGKMKVLDLSKNKIEKINYEILRPLLQLEHLDLSNNLIVQINNYCFRHLRNLLYLNLEKNSIIQIDSEALNVPKLKLLKLAHNKLSNLYSDYSFLLHYLDEVEDIDLSNNKISRIDQSWVNLVKLKNVNLANNNFTVLGIGDILFLNDKVRINLNSNPLNYLDLTNLETFVKQQSSTNNLWNTGTREITLSGNQLICDCRNYEFARYLHNKMPNNFYKYLKIEQNLLCNDGTEFINVQIDSLTCDWKLYYDSEKVDCPECECTYRPYDNSAIMNCSNRNLTLAPKIIISSKHINYTELNLRNNFITKLPNYEHLNIRKLNVGNNNLTTINITQLPKAIMVSRLTHFILLTYKNKTKRKF